MAHRHLAKLVMVASLFAFLLAGTVAWAAKDTKTDQTKASKADQILAKVSKEGNTAMRDVRWARVAIFEGHPQHAEKMLEAAKKNLDITEKQAPQLLVALGSKAKGTGAQAQANLIPIDAWMMLSENFVATPEKTAKIKEANKHLKKGEKGKALEVLRSAGIDVYITRLLMPLQATVKDVDKALSLVKEQKYYEANLALKGAEDGLITDTIGFDQPATPAKKASTPKKK
jgi:outer membrane PBP1 activator LpoA protein